MEDEAGETANVSQSEGKETGTEENMRNRVMTEGKERWIDSKIGIGMGSWRESKRKRYEEAQTAMRGGLGRGEVHYEPIRVYIQT